MDELKSKAYDAIIQIELWKAKLAELQNLITNYKEPEPSQEEDFEPKTDDNN